ncbi:MAG: hypothetical protein N2663_03110 [Chlorobi bacterium]|nr:hypothetical protein [Chlorobiota bacterium]
MVRWSVLTIALACTAAFATVGGDSIVRVIQISSQELLIVPTASTLRYREDVSSPPGRIRIELFGMHPADSIREVTFPSSSVFSSMYLRNKSNGSLVLIECKSPVGHVVAVLPYSKTLYIRAVDWNDPGQCYMAWGIAAWESGQYAQALRFWRSALGRGVRDAAVWLGIAEALQRRYKEALEILGTSSANTLLPDADAARAIAFAAEGREENAAPHRLRYLQAIGRQPIEPAAPIIQSISTESNAPSLVDIFQQQIEESRPANPASPLTPPTSNTVSSDSDLFAQLRQLQQRKTDTTNAVVSPAGSLGGGFTTLLLAGGALLLLTGVILLRSYRRWRNQRIETLSTAIHTMQASTQTATQKQEGSASADAATFDQLLKLVNTVHATPQHNQQQTTDDQSALFDFDDETYIEHEKRKNSAEPAIDERLLYQSEANYQLSSESPTAASAPLSEQERDLLRMLEKLSREFDADGDANAGSQPR